MAAVGTVIAARGNERTIQLSNNQKLTIKLDQSGELNKLKVGDRAPDDLVRTWDTPSSRQSANTRTTR